MQAREFLRQGKTGDARKCFQKCVDISSEMALELMKACRAKNVDCIVAPYEADAQLAYLSLQGFLIFLKIASPYIICIFFFFETLSLVILLVIFLV